MFNRNYTLVVDGNNSDKDFKNLFMVLHTFGRINNIKDVQVKDGPMTVIETEMSKRQWKKLTAGMDNIGLPMFRVGDYWFI